MTELLFNNDAYLKQCEAVITHIDQNSIQLDRTIFYAESGGQPGDQGEIILDDQIYKVIDTQKGKAPNEIVDPSLLDKEAMNQQIEEIIKNNIPVFTKQITGDEFRDNPHLAKGAAVSPPVIDNKVQIVQIGEDKILDIQACGGTHVKSTGEIEGLEIGKIENKGKRNRRVNIRFKQ